MRFTREVHRWRRICDYLINYLDVQTDVSHYTEYLVLVNQGLVEFYSIFFYKSRPPLIFFLIIFTTAQTFLTNDMFCVGLIITIAFWARYSPLFFVLYDIFTGFQFLFTNSSKCYDKGTGKEIIQDKELARSYFRKYGVHLPPFRNPAERREAFTI